MPSHTAAALLGGLLASAPGGMPASAPGKVLLPAFKAWSIYAGNGRYSFDTKIHGTPDFPCLAKVRLVREIDAVCVAEKWSDPVTGQGVFEGFDPSITYSVIGYEFYGPADFTAVILSGQLLDVVSS